MTPMERRERPSGGARLGREQDSCGLPIGCRTGQKIFKNVQWEATIGELRRSARRDNKLLVSDVRQNWQFLVFARNF